MDASTRTFFVAGVKFRPDYIMVRKGLLDCGFNGTNGEIAVDLRGEPKNQFDKFAVKCLIGGTHIGYVPKPINVDLWALHDAGYKSSAKLIGFDPGAETYQMFKVQVTFSKP